MLINGRLFSLSDKHLEDGSLYTFAVEFVDSEFEAEFQQGKLCWVARSSEGSLWGTKFLHGWHCFKVMKWRSDTILVTEWLVINGHRTEL